MNISFTRLNKVNFIGCKESNYSENPVVNEQPLKNRELSDLSLQIQDIKCQEMLSKLAFLEFLKHSSKLTKEEYYNIIEKNPNLLLQSYRYSDEYKGEIKPSDMAKIALKTSEYIKKRFGDCRIISLGTSPAPLMEQLALLNHDVLFVPVSGMSKYNPQKYSLEDLPDLKAILEYVKSKNIKDGKLNLILDYTYTGATLDYMCQLLEEYCKLDWGDYVSMSMQDLLSLSVSDEELKQKFKNDMIKGDMEDLANIAHFPVIPIMKSRYLNDIYTIESANKTQQELNFEFENYAKPLARAYSLCTFHEIQKLK